MVQQKGIPVTLRYLALLFVCVVPRIAVAQDSFHDLVAAGTPFDIRAAVVAGADLEERTGEWGFSPVPRICYGISDGSLPEVENNYTPLMRAVVSGPLDNVLTLIELGADVNATTEGGLTPLMLAVCMGSVEKVASLIEAGADVNARSLLGWSALVFASNAYPPRGSGDWHPEPMAAAPQMAEMLIRAGAELEVRTSIGQTPLHYAVGQKYRSTVLVLLEAGANTEAATRSGWTALLTAARDGSVEIVEDLLRAGANPNSRNDGGYTALMYAAAFSTPETVNALIRGGADTEARTLDGLNALLYAFVARSEGKSLPNLLALLEGGANVEARSATGRTLLMSVARYGTPEEVEALLDAGANPGAQDNTGKSVFEYALENEGLRGTRAFWRLNDARF